MRTIYAATIDQTLSVARLIGDIVADTATD